MSFKTIDNAFFDSITSTEVMQKPVIGKEYAWIEDNNATSTYSTSQVQFTTERFGNNGKYNNYNEGIILLPIVISVTGTNVDKSDVFLALKNSNMNIINKLTVHLNNTSLVAGADYINQYLIFKQHSEMSDMDEELNGCMLGYAKDSSSSWGYAEASSIEGDGLLNNMFCARGQIPDMKTPNSVENLGFRKRMGYFSRDDVNGKDKILEKDKYGGHYNKITNVGTGLKVYHYNAYIRLKDLPFFDRLPPMRSGVLRIILTLNNNVSFTVTKNNTAGANVGKLSVSNFINNTSTTNPLMFSASYKSIVSVNDANTVGDIDPETVIVASGASLIGAEAVSNDFNIRLSLATNKDASNNGHPITKCRLYVPFYDFSVGAEQEYLSNKIKTVEYLDISFFPFTVNVSTNNYSTAFNQPIVNGVSRMRRLIMIGIISSGNGTTNIPADSSPFTSEPSTTSPFKISNLNVKVGGINLYNPAVMEYDYEQFLLELNGQQGINANLTQGLCSSRISLQDFNNNYHYIVVNLDRKLPENENSTNSLDVSGRLECKKSVTFYCFVESYKQVKIDVETGVIVM